MNEIDAAIDAGVAALFGLESPRLVEEAVLTPPGGAASAVLVLVFRRDQPVDAGSVSLQREGAVVLIDQRDLPTRPPHDTVVAAARTWRIRTATRGTRFWVCEAMAA